MLTIPSKELRPLLFQDHLNDCRKSTFLNKTLFDSVIPSLYIVLIPIHTIHKKKSWGHIADPQTIHSLHSVVDLEFPDHFL